MNTAIIDFPSIFTKEQIDYIGLNVVESAREVCGDKLCDVTLYGSYARGDFDEWSDVDIMVLVDADDTECKQVNKDINDKLYDLIFHMNLLLSVMVVPHDRFYRMKNNYPFYSNVSKEGVRLC